MRVYLTESSIVMHRALLSAVCRYSSNHLNSIKRTVKLIANDLDAVQQQFVSDQLNFIHYAMFLAMGGLHSSNIE